MTETAPWWGPISKKYLFVNFVTGVRLPAAIITLIAIAGGKWWPTAGIVMLAGLATDFLDGHLARKWSVTSGFGAAWDGQLDRLLLLSPILGMSLHGDIPLWSGAVLTIGLYVADALAESFELMRIVWWPACYATIGYGLVRHATTSEFLIILSLFGALSAIMIATHTSEVARVSHKLRR